MHLLRIHPAAHLVEDRGTALPSAAPEPGSFWWLACERTQLEARLPEIQAMLQAVCGAPLLDLHVSDLLNAHIPSTSDYTSQYDVMLFHRLVDSGASDSPAAIRAAGKGGTAPPPTPVLQRVRTQPIGFAVYDQLLLTVHPPACPLQQQFQQRLETARQVPEGRPGAAKLPHSPADLMLRMLNQMVDGYLDLRRVMTRQLDHWQLSLLRPRAKFHDWSAVLDARLALHQLDEICEDQRGAVQDWIEAMDSWPDDSGHDRREHELLRVRSRDVLEHIERVIHHVRRIEQSAEAAVQMHFSSQSNRANDIMRTLTTLTAVFLPLNLIAAIFGMNFEFIPWIHQSHGFWWAMASMGLIALALLVFFWRRRYLDRNSLR